MLTHILCPMLYRRLSGDANGHPLDRERGTTRYFRKAPLRGRATFRSATEGRTATPTAARSGLRQVTSYGGPLGGI